MRPVKLSEARLLLACDTSQAACSVALVHGGAVLGSACEVMVRGHSETLMVMLERMMAEADKDFAVLDGLAVTIGPGTFTGVRTGLAAMRGLALALDKPLLGIGTLHAMAQAADMGLPVLVAVDARRDTYYCQALDENKVPVSEPQALSLVEAQNLLRVGDVEVIGTGKVALNGVDARFRVSAAADYPVAENVARLAVSMARAEWPEARPQPLYLRPADATLPDPKKRLQRLSRADEMC